MPVGRPTTADLAGTPLGRMMTRRGYTIKELIIGSGIDKDTMTDYLHARAPRGGTGQRKRDGNGSHGSTSKMITPRHMVRLCAFLKCQPEEIQHTR